MKLPEQPFASNWTGQVHTNTAYHMLVLGTIGSPSGVFERKQESGDGGKKEKVEKEGKEVGGRKRKGEDERSSMWVLGGTWGGSINL